MAAQREKFLYGGAAIPSNESKYSIIRWGFGGLNRTDLIDTGQVTDCSCISIEPPYVLPAVKPKLFLNYSDPQAIFGFGENLLVIYNTSSATKIDYVTPEKVVYTGTLSGNMRVFDYRSAVQFNKATNTENIVNATFKRKILIFPDAYSMDFDISSSFTPLSLGSAYPGLKYASVYGSRVFGVDDNLVYASSYNDYADWNLDTADETNDANAWVSMSQSNVKADGTFTAITTYDNHIVLFKSDFMQLVYNNKNPFRIVDVGSYGCDNPYAVAEAGGILYFASADTVYAYGGGTPKSIGDCLDLDDLRGAVLGSWGDVLYMYAAKSLYAYKNGVWSNLGYPGADIIQFASLDYGLAALFGNGDISFIDWSESAAQAVSGDDWTPEYSDDWWFETDLMAAGKLDIRRVKKLSILCEADSGAEMTVYLLRDGEKFDSLNSVSVGSFIGSGGLGIMRVLTRQFSGYMHRLRIVGHGRIKIYAVELKISWGGDVYVDG